MCPDTGLPRDFPGAGEYVFTKRELAERLKISERTITRDMAAGLIKPLRWGRAVRFPLSEVERYLRSKAT